MAFLCSILLKEVENVCISDLNSVNNRHTGRFDTEK